MSRNPDAEHHRSGNRYRLAYTQPADDQLSLFLAYREWLDNEARVLGAELFEGFYGEDACRIIPQSTGVAKFHFPGGKQWLEMPPASGRAATVMGAAGVDLSAIDRSYPSDGIWWAILDGRVFVKKGA
jgi:hypothetical protein